MHLRDGAELASVVGYTARVFARAIVMPNLAPPVTTVDRYVEDYFREVHLSAASAAHTDFLVRSSILERLSAGLCDAVLARDDSVQMLETLEQTVIPAGPGHPADQPAATLVIGTHEASEADLAATVATLTGNDVVHSVTSVLRVEGL